MIQSKKNLEFLVIFGANELSWLFVKEDAIAFICDSVYVFVLTGLRKKKLESLLL